MFKNSGTKVKIIARVLLIVQFVAFIAGAVICFTKEEPDIPTGILLIVGGFFSAWFGALILYAVGSTAEAAEEAAAMNESMKKQLNNIERKMDLYFVDTLPPPRDEPEKKKDKKK